MSRLSYFVFNSGGNNGNNRHSGHFGHYGRYNTLWTPSPLDGMQEVGGSNPYRDDEDDIILSTNLLPLQSSKFFRTTFLKVSSNGEIVREIKWNQQLNS